MNQRGAAIAVFGVMMFLIPLLALNSETGKVQFHNKSNASSVSPEQQENPVQEQKDSPPAAELTGAEGGFRIFDEQTGRVFEVTERDYVRGALAAEMPPTFHPEAMKAQAVAAHTYAACLRAQARENGKKSDFSADPENWKVYTTEKLFRERYKDLADAYWNTICQAADEVAGYLLLYQGEPIVAAYHSMSSGKTEDAANVWTGGKPYLVPVDSFGDTLAPDYRMSETISEAKLEQALRKQWPEITLEGDPSGWFGEPQRSSSGYITQITVGGQSMSGMELRNALDLRSSDFTVSYDAGEFTFKVVGYGHGVGLSQYGADYMARQGASFDEILLHYYQGATLSTAVF